MQRHEPELPQITPAAYGNGEPPPTLSPFMTAPSAAAMLKLSIDMIQRRLRGGQLPGYRLAGGWLIPRDELILHTAPHTGQFPKAIDTETAVTHLTAGLPQMIGLETLSHFLGLRRPYLYRALTSLPRQPLNETPAGAVTLAAVHQMLVRARNSCPPLKTAQHREHPPHAAPLLEVS